MKKIGLLKQYIQVKRESGIITFGGDQNFFYTSKASAADLQKKSFGCGIIAFADLLLYLGNSDDRFLTEENRKYVRQKLSENMYKEYFDRIYKLIGGLTNHYGISGLKIRRNFNRIARRNGWKLRAKWGCSGKKIFTRIEEMLGNNIPVILCIPMMILKKDKDCKLALYHRIYDEQTQQYLYQVAERTNAHYVTVTEILWEGERRILKIASWGKEYYIDFEEYDSYIHTHFLGKILGNILYVR